MGELDHPENSQNVNFVILVDHKTICPYLNYPLNKVSISISIRLNTID